MRRHLRGRADSRRVGAAQVLHRFARREVHQVHRLPRFAREVEVARDHQALAERRPAGEPELGSDRPGMRVAAEGQRRLLAMHGDHATGHGVVLKCAPHHAGGSDRTAVVGEAGGAGVSQCAHLRELRPSLALRDRGHEADRDVRLRRRACAQAAEHIGVVDDGIGVRNREDRAVTAGGGCGSAAFDRLLVLTARCAQVNVRIDESRCKHVARTIDHAMLVRVEVEADLRDHSAVDPHVENRVDPLNRVEDASTTDDDVVGANGARQHHATSTAVSTATGPVVSRS